VYFAGQLRIVEDISITDALMWVSSR
jgi:hypothetical protein